MEESGRELANVCLDLRVGSEVRGIDVGTDNEPIPSGRGDKFMCGPNGLNGGTDVERGREIRRVDGRVSEGGAAGEPYLAAFCASVKTCSREEPKMRAYEMLVTEQR